MLYLKVPDTLPEDGSEDRPGFGLQTRIAPFQESQHPRNVFRIDDHETRFQFELGSDKLKKKKKKRL